MFKPTLEELEEILELHKKWLNGDVGGVRASLDGASLEGASLVGANLEGASLDGASLVRANLDGARLIRASLDGARLIRANLEGASLEGAILDGARLDGANLEGANLVGANLVRASLDGASLDGASLDGASLIRANLEGASLEGASLVRASLEGANLVGANLVRASLVGANLEGASLAAAYLQPIKEDIKNILNSAPAEVQGLLDLLNAGKIEGRVYEGECACLVGSIAKIRGVELDALGIRIDSDSPAECWFLAINKGATPENNPVAAITKEWIEEWLSAHPQPATEEELHVN